MRVFVDGGEAVQQLLVQCVSKGTPEEADGIHQLLSHFPASTDKFTITSHARTDVQGQLSSSGLIEPLTAREQEVLELIAAGCTNREIADRLGKFLGQLSLSSLWMLRYYQPESLAKQSAKQWGIPEAYLPLFQEDLVHATSADFNRTLIENLMRQELPECLPAPLLVTVGRKETIPAKQAARKLTRLYREATGRMVPGMGHVWALQTPDLFAATIKAWVSENPLPAALQPLS